MQTFVGFKNLERFADPTPLTLQDNETATAVGFKSYNDLMMAGLVTLAEKSPIGQGCGESSVDFTATPTRTPTSAEHSRLGRGGDIQEHNALLRTLRLSAINYNNDWDSTSSSRDSQDSSSGGTSSSGYSVDLMDTGSGCTSPPGKGNLKSRCDDQISSKESRDGMFTHIPLYSFVHRDHSIHFLRKLHHGWIFRCGDQEVLEY